MVDHWQMLQKDIHKLYIVNELLKHEKRIVSDFTKPHFSLFPGMRMISPSDNTIRKNLKELENIGIVEHEEIEKQGFFPRYFRYYLKKETKKELIRRIGIIKKQHKKNKFIKKIISTISCEHSKSIFELYELALVSISEPRTKSEKSLLSTLLSSVIGIEIVNENLSMKDLNIKDNQSTQ